MIPRLATWALVSQVLVACGQYQAPLSGELEEQIALDEAPAAPGVMAAKAPAFAEEAVPRRRHCS